MKIINFIFLAVLLLPLSVFANNPVKKDSVPQVIKYLDYDRNLDSLISCLYSKPENTENPFILTEADSSMIYADRPDSFFINRLEKIPSVISLTYNNIVKRYIEVYTIKKRAKLEEILGLKEYYFPMFEEILDKYSLPLELKYLAVIESALNPRAVSHCGATGLWQFMYGTGRLYKLEINSYVDERRDPVAETYAAARFLKDLYTAYNDWILVIAAYNCGPGNVNKAIRRSGGKTSYWDIYPYLPRETRGYVPAFIAATYSMIYFKDHNLTPKYVNMPLRTDTIMVRENIHLQQIADVLKVPVEMVRDLNPQYRRDVIPGKYSACSLMLPAQYATRYIDFRDSIASYRKDEFFANEFKIINPVNSRGSYTASAPSGNTAKIYHKITSGQTLGQISEKYGVKIADIKYWNNIRGSNIQAGKRLIVYVPKKSASKHIASTSKNADESGYVYYEVKNGDTIYKIANLYQGVTEADLIKWNNLASGDKIHPGQTIKIKRTN